jgi:hypothetical protein
MPSNSIKKVALLEVKLPFLISYGRCKKYPNQLGLLSSIGTIHIIADGFNRRKIRKVPNKFHRNGAQSRPTCRSYGTC